MYQENIRKQEMGKCDITYHAKHIMVYIGYIDVNLQCIQQNSSHNIVHLFLISFTIVYNMSIYLHTYTELNEGWP
jgi:hypothetical protein